MADLVNRRYRAGGRLFSADVGASRTDVFSLTLEVSSEVVDASAEGKCQCHSASVQHAGRIASSSRTCSLSREHVVIRSIRAFMNSG